MRVPLSHIPLKKNKCSDNAAPKSPFHLALTNCILTKPKEQSLLNSCINIKLVKGGGDGERKGREIKTKAKV